MSADTRQVVLRSRGKFFTAIVQSSEDCLDTDRGVRWEEIVEIFKRRSLAGPFETVEIAVAHRRVFEEEGEYIEYDKPLILEVDEENQDVRELALEGA